MLRVMMKSKIHGATVTEANLRYTGSITIDRDLLKAADMMPFERVQIVNLNNGTRVETYILEGAAGSGTICMNGAAAHLIKEGEEIIIMGFELTDAPVEPKMILVDKNNKFIQYL